MEIDFDDILRDFERDSRPNEASQTKLKEDDLQELTQSWISERMAPELLEYKDALIERMLSRIREQVEFIELNSIELQTQEKDIKLQLMIIESEIDRVNFILRSYLRTRLSKVSIGNFSDLSVDININSRLTNIPSSSEMTKKWFRDYRNKKQHTWRNTLKHYSSFTIHYFYHLYHSIYKH